MQRTLSRWALFAAMLFLVGCDHATKVVARDALVSGRVITLIRGWLDLRYTENFDTAFSLTHGWDGAAKSVVLMATTVVTTAVVLVIAWRRRNRGTRLERAGLGLVLAGAIGNTLDRVRRGYVVDFIHVHHWPIFNVADILVVVGALLLLASSWVSGRHPPQRLSSA
jgi:signal peptidase II